MEKIIERILANNLRDFGGTRIKGQLVLHDALVNEVLGLSLAELAKPAASAEANETSATETATSPAPDLRALFAAMRIDQLDYRAEQGRVTLDLDLSIPEND